MLNNVLNWFYAYILRYDVMQEKIYFSLTFSYYSDVLFFSKLFGYYLVTIKMHMFIY